MYFLDNVSSIKIEIYPYGPVGSMS